MSTLRYIGAHVSIAGGAENAPLNAQALGANAFALFVKNQRQWKAKPLSDENIQGFKQNLALTGIAVNHIVAHDSYLINLGHPDRAALKKSRDAFLEEVRRCQQLGVTCINIHPGSHLRVISEDKCLQRIADSINQTLEKTFSVKILLENTAGQGSNMGHRFEQLATIISQIQDQTRIGVCLDTCHTFAAGYDLRTPETYSHTWKAFDTIVGRSYLCALHINDAKTDFNSHVDRHAPIGQGKLGINAFTLLVRDTTLQHLPFILETPDSENWRQEIQMLRDLQQNQ
jgi:deoxyribonuclease IV